MYTLENVEVEFNTRNDPSICPRIYPVCEAMVRIALWMLYILQKAIGQSAAT